MTTDVSGARNDTRATGPGARVPKYYRVKQRVLEMTQSRTPGARMPAERLLALELNTSRTTVRRALQELVGEGRLDRMQGKGTFVARPKLSRTLQLMSHTEDMHAQGLAPASRTLDIRHIEADDKLAQLLDIDVGDRVLRIERLRLASGEPMAIETSHLSARRFPALAASLATHRSLYTALAEVYGVHLTEAQEVIETSLATPRDATLLATEVGHPVLLLCRHSQDAHGAPVEWVRSVYRGSRYKFVVNLKPPPD
ncbi:GntR family transcriptional regulator [Streptomyces aurantiacus]|uniref:HTH-type transcriptional repressor DasR n=1 Tax=Streptomyces aurantiacus TaxID=47760 RepID=A0A7G1NUA5_9ACTN|nr:GntR family transcriptional regulator [Streptomyces aurantiacus]BCL25214.1 HTH-type transcriptional repressor DasR [Streptomyces aurantiacus]